MNLRLSIKPDSDIKGEILVPSYSSNPDEGKVIGEGYPFRSCLIIDFELQVPARPFPLRSPTKSSCCLLKQLPGPRLLLAQTIKR